MDLSKIKTLSFFINLKSRIKSISNTVLGFFGFQKKINIGNDNLDQKLVASLAKTKFPTLLQLKYLKNFLTPKELLAIRISLVVVAISVLFLSVNFYKNHLSSVPVFGGEYVEGVVGSPQFINPLYASTNEVDSALSRLVFSSLLKRNKNGELVGDLAMEFSSSADGKSYTVKIRDNVKWHNGDPVTVDDVIFTFNAIKDSAYHSPLRASFNGVEIEKIDEQTIKFNLAEPYSAFLNLLEFGILPEFFWSEVPPQAFSLNDLNLKPIGSGPYKIKSFSRDKNGNIISYSLLANEDYYSPSAYIEKITFKFFPNSEELINNLNSGDVDGVDFLSAQDKEKVIAQDSLNFHSLQMPQLTAIFFNLRDKNSFWSDKKIRQALALAVNRDLIINQVYGGNAKKIASPIFLNSFAFNGEVKKYEYNKEEAEKILQSAGWKRINVSKDDLLQAEIAKNSTDVGIKEDAENKLILGEGSWLAKEINKKLVFFTITLSTVDNETSKRVVEEVKKDWEAIGAKTILNILSTKDLTSEVIKPKNFEALYYGEILGGDPDVYVYWHSSQSDKGLNLPGYINKDTDILLEEGRSINDRNQRIEKYKKFQEIIADDLPAIFMLNPDYLYLQTKKIKGFDLNIIINSADRFSKVSDWYLKTGKKLIW